jgi:hypothetical protein
LRLAFCEFREAGIENLLYAATLHLLAGAVTGSVFKVPALLLLLFFVVVEAAILSIVDIYFAGCSALVSLSMVQVGYIAGAYARGGLGQAGYSRPPG